MQIRRIQRIKGYRVFREAAWPADADGFARFNLIYGWNGSGKTTLARLFRHIQERSPLVEGEVHLEIDDRLVSGSELSSAVLPEVRVFDCSEVKRTVLEDPRGQLPPIYYLGEDSVEKLEQIEQLREARNSAIGEMATLDQDLQAEEVSLERFRTDRAREIKNLLTVSGGGPYNNYDAPRFKAAADRLLQPDAEAKRLDSETRERYLETKAGTSRPKVSKSVADFPDLRALTRHVKDVAEMTVLSKPLPGLESDAELETWVGNGLELHEARGRTETCAFCGNKLSEKRLTSLQGHFSSEFRNLLNQIAGSLRLIEETRTEIARLQPPDSGLLYSHLLADYGKACQQFEVIRSDARTYLEALEAVLEAKRTLPFEAVQARDQLVQTCSERVVTLFEDSGPIESEGDSELPGDPGAAAWQSVQSVLESHNRLTDQFNQELDAARRALEEDQVAAALDDLHTHRKTVKSARERAEEAKSRAGDLQKEIRLLELDLRTHRRPAEELNQELAAYLGHSDLALSVEESGYVITRNGQPAMNLSEGEKTAIAFMHFLKSLSDTSFDLAKSVVVIDDPISSLDANSLFSAFAFMRERTEGAGQLFVLTHNFSFFRQVRKWFHSMPGQGKKDLSKRPSRFFMLECQYSNGVRCASLAKLDPLLEKYHTEYHYLFSKLHDVAFGPTTEGSLEVYYGKPNMARRLMEAFLEFRMPGQGGLTKKFESLPVEKAQKNRVLPFLHTYSHLAQVPEPEHDPSVLSETPAILRDFFGIIEELDLSHYKGMCELIGATPNAQSVSEDSE